MGGESDGGGAGVMTAATASDDEEGALMVEVRSAMGLMGVAATDLEVRLGKMVARQMMMVLVVLRRDGDDGDDDGCCDAVDGRWRRRWEMQGGMGGGAAVAMAVRGSDRDGPVAAIGCDGRR
ncbi:hypothetical protein F0562_030869 [Nyssa sinensis]|uniref:Uncharacterized protein n=1 Tax=Nyssa sinensis TaxID=561372 RepID=A0A5J5B3W7_9ASTE|nr:hypothetical protein F0562_030869 [Nyssa sinensis]